MARRPIESIAILVHPQQRMPYGAFLRRIIDQCWKPEGRRVFIQEPFAANAPKADCAIVHVDLTHVPPVYAEWAARFPLTVNARALDISKRRICTTLVGPNDDWNGPVVVKTDLNHRGDSERRLGQTVPDHDWILPDEGYRMFDRKSDVPDRVWRDAGLVVQKLHVERHGEWYVLHQWFFLGDRDIVSTYYGTSPMLKQATMTKRPPLTFNIPDALRARRAELGFDYGKFDYVIEEGVPHLIDANTTPNNGTRIDTRRCAVLCAHLAPGIDAIAERALA